MSNKVTMQDIADKLGVTKVSVSKALSNQPGISEGLRRRVNLLAEELSYVPKKKTVMRNGFTFLFIVSKRFFLETDRFYSIIHYHLNKLCLNQGHTLTLIVLNTDEENNGTMPIEINNKTISGAFLAGELDEKCLVKLKQSNIAMVALDFYRYDLEIDSIVADNFQLGYWATMLLIEKGHTEIGFVGNLLDTSSIADRYFGYVKAMTLKNLPIKSEFTIVNNIAKTGKYTSDINLPNKLPSAFVCHCEMAAYYLKKTLLEINLKVPDNISLVSFDDTDIGRDSGFNLTTFNIGRHEIADKALKVMMENILTGSKEHRRHYIYSKLVERNSILDMRK